MAFLDHNVEDGRLISLLLAPLQACLMASSSWATQSNRPSLQPSVMSDLLGFVNASTMLQRTSSTASGNVLHVLDDLLSADQAKVLDPPPGPMLTALGFQLAINGGDAGAW